MWRYGGIGGDWIKVNKSDSLHVIMGFQPGHKLGGYSTGRARALLYEACGPDITAKSLAWLRDVAFGRVTFKRTLTTSKGEVTQVEEEAEPRLRADCHRYLIERDIGKIPQGVDIQAVVGVVDVSQDETVEALRRLSTEEFDVYQRLTSKLWRQPPAGELPPATGVGGSDVVDAEIVTAPAPSTASVAVGQPNKIKLLDRLKGPK